MPVTSCAERHALGSAACLSLTLIKIQCCIAAGEDCSRHTHWRSGLEERGTRWGVALPSSANVRLEASWSVWTLEPRCESIRLQKLLAPLAFRQTLTPLLERAMGAGASGDRGANIEDRFLAGVAR